MPAARDGRAIYEKAFGHADADFRVPNWPDTRFGIDLITKRVTGVILNRLIEEKKIAPEDRPSKFIPDFPGGDKITIRLLRPHRSGIPHRGMRPEAEPLPYTSAEFRPVSVVRPRLSLRRCVTTSRLSAAHRPAARRNANPASST